MEVMLRVSLTSLSAKGEDVTQPEIISPLTESKPRNPNQSIEPPWFGRFFIVVWMSEQQADFMRARRQQPDDDNRAHDCIEVSRMELSVATLIRHKRLRFRLTKLSASAGARWFSTICSRVWLHSLLLSSDETQKKIITTTLKIQITSEKKTSFIMGEKFVLKMKVECWAGGLHNSRLGVWLSTHQKKILSVLAMRSARQTCSEKPSGSCVRMICFICGT